MRHFAKLIFFFSTMIRFIILSIIITHCRFVSQRNRMRRAKGIAKSSEISRYTQYFPQQVEIQLMSRTDPECLLDVALRVEGRFVDRFLSPFQKYAYRDIPCTRVVPLSTSSPPLPFSLVVVRRRIDFAFLRAPRSLFPCIAAKRAVITFVLITPVHTHSIYPSMCPAGGSTGRKKRGLLGLRYLPIAVTSAPNCAPKQPEALPRPLSASLSPFRAALRRLSPSSTRVDLDLVSRRRRIFCARSADTQLRFPISGPSRLARNSRSF